MKLGRKWLLQIMINEQPADFCDFVLVHLSFGFQPNLITKTQRKTQKHGLKDRAFEFLAEKEGFEPSRRLPDLLP